MTREEEIQQAAIDACGNTVDWAFRMGAQWSDSHPHKGLVDIDKVCDWLINHNDYICGSTNGIARFNMEQLVNDFKKAMTKGE